MSLFTLPILPLTGFTTNVSLIKFTTLVPVAFITTEFAPRAVPYDPIETELFPGNENPAFVPMATEFAPWLSYPADAPIATAPFP